MLSLHLSFSLMYSFYCRYTPDQVQGRWSNLVTLYQRMVEHNARPDNEPITVAFKDHIERIFNYVPERNSKWLKIMEKRGKTPKAMTSMWCVTLYPLFIAKLWRQRRIKKYCYCYWNYRIVLGVTIFWEDCSLKLRSKEGTIIIIFI